MSNTTTSPNMGLIIPNVTVDPGPDYASNINTTLSTIDQHNHSPGSGVQVTPSGLLINTDLPFNINNAITLRSSRYYPQSTPLSLPADIGCTYVVLKDLYYNDTDGNMVRITQNGGVVGSPGVITGLVSPASASYVVANSTFVWQSDVNTPAIMDMASLILRNLVANSFGLSIFPPNAMGADYSIVMPPLPGSTSFLQIDASGNEVATIPVAAGITSANIAPATILGSNIDSATITAVNMAATQVLSSSCGNYFLGPSSTADVTNLTCTITTNGGPVVVALQDDGTNSGTFSAISSGSLGAIFFFNGASQIASMIFPGGSVEIPTSSYNFVDYSVVGVPGTYIYKVQAQTNANGVSILRTALSVMEVR